MNLLTGQDEGEESQLPPAQPGENRSISPGVQREGQACVLPEEGAVEVDRLPLQPNGLYFSLFIELNDDDDDL